MQLVFEFGSKMLRPTIDAIRVVIGSLEYGIECVPKGSDTNRATTDTLQSAAIKLERGDISAFTLRPRVDGDIRYALVLGPFYDGQQLSLYFGTIEYTGDDYAPIWNLLLGTPGLSLACIGDEEGVELQDAQLTPDTFPWRDWPLVIGALRDTSDSGVWIVREGPGMKRFKIPMRDNGHSNEESIR